jgi:hypothetical protein
MPQAFAPGVAAMQAVARSGASKLASLTAPKRPTSGNVC